MSTQTAAYRETIEHLPAGATLILHHVSWDDYERLVEDLLERPGVRVRYDSGTLEIMTTSPEHEMYARFIDRIVGGLAEAGGITVEHYGSTTWKRQALLKGIEPDACYYIANAARIIGKLDIRLDTDPPPDLAVEIEVTSGSLSKFRIYAALGVPEIWRYDGTTASFYALSASEYIDITESRSFPGFMPALLAETIEHSKTVGQTAALAAFRRRWPA